MTRTLAKSIQTATNTKDFFLSFSLHYNRDGGLDQGRLKLNSLRQGNLDIWIATSSYSTKQYKESFHERGGIIPPEYRVPGINKWEVDLNPIDLRHNKGVAGNFYRLLPYEVKTDKGGTRSDIGIHIDGNAPGSLGCIVMSRDRFASVEQWFAKLRGWGITKIPLFVTLT